MPDRNVAWIKKFTGGQIGGLKMGSLLMRLNAIVPQSSKLLAINVDRYREVPSVHSALANKRDFGTILHMTSEILPTLPFVVSGQLKSQPNYSEIGQAFQIASLGCLIHQYGQTTSPVQHFLNRIDPSIDIYSSSELGKRGEDTHYLPKLVHGDLHLIIKGLKLKPSASRDEIIEHYYTMKAFSLFFLRYYFDLMNGARNDEESYHIDSIFLNFFTSLRFHEEQYWQGYSNSDKLQAQLTGIIDQDNPATRHKVLNRIVFDELKAFNPMIHDGGSRSMSMSMKKLLQKQLDTFRSMPLTKMALFLRVLLNNKDRQYASYLVTQVAKANPGKLQNLHNFLQAMDEESYDKNGILRIISPMVQKMPTPKTIFQSEEKQRMVKAQKNLQERKPQAAYTAEHLTNYFESYLERLYKKVHKEGALNQNNIAEYLERFAKKAMEIAQKANITVKEKQVFEESIEETLKEFSQNDLSSSEMADYQEGLQEELEGFEDASVEERIQKVEVIGNVLSAAAEMAENKKEADEEERVYNDSLAIEIQVDEDPKHRLTIGSFLDQPISQKEKMRYLLSHTPTPIPLETHKVIERVQFRCGRSSSNPIEIYKNNNLQKRSLIRLLFPHHPFKELLQREIIPILPEKDKPNISVRDFFTFPFAEKKKGPLAEEDYFNQHYYYLKMALDNGALAEGDHQILIDNQENFQALQYQKYFNIVRKKRFEDTAFMAVYCLWQNNGLKNIRTDLEA